MAKIYKSALGRQVDMDQLRLANEDVIAVGNMKVNARGDELGFGGQVLRTRNDVMNEHYKLHGTLSKHDPEVVRPDEAFLHAKPPEKPTLRGALANAILKPPVRQLDDQDGEK